MTVGSLFSGIGGFDLGLERAGMRVAWQCEADEFCRRVLARHWPDVPCYPDVRELSGAAVAPVDILCGGFPCQDISLAGKGAGIDGARSGLWGEYARLVGELRPSYVIVENVAALLARGLGRVLGDLAALGYDAEWDCLPASAFGAPHQRDRLWLVAYPEGVGGTDGTGVAAREALVGAVAGAGGRVVDGDATAGVRLVGSGAEGRAGRGAAVSDADGGGRLARLTDVQAGEPDVEGRSDDVADADDIGCAEGLLEPTGRDERAGPRDAIGRGELQDADERALLAWRVGGRAAQAGGSEWWAVEPPVGRVAHGVPDQLDQLAALGNALVPQIAEWLGRRILETEALRAA